MKNNFCPILIIILAAQINVVRAATKEGIVLEAAAAVDKTQSVIISDGQKDTSSRQEKIKKAKQSYLAGQEFYRQGDYQSADREFKRAQQSLESVSVQAVSGINLPQKTAVSKAAFRGGHPLPRTGKFQSLVTQAWEFSQKGQPQEAICSYLKAVKIDSKNVNLYYNLAVEYIKINEFDYAVEALERVVVLNPQDKDAWYNLGVLFETYFGDKMQAVEYYRRYVKSAPQAEDVNQVKEWIAQINSSQ
ncbi:MAG: tetratricopeptide repeat protein [Candidatus Omnitrophota bacterium]